MPFLVEGPVRPAETSPSCEQLLADCGRIDLVGVADTLRRTLPQEVMQQYKNLEHDETLAGVLLHLLLYYLVYLFNFVSLFPALADKEAVVLHQWRLLVLFDEAKNPAFSLGGDLMVQSAHLLHEIGAHLLGFLSLGRW